MIRSLLSTAYTSIGIWQDYYSDTMGDVRKILLDEVTTASVFTVSLPCFSLWLLSDTLSSLMSAWLIAILDMQQCGANQRAHGQDIVCLTPTTQGISLTWTDPHGQVDFLCLQRCWIFHWLLSARQRWVKSLLAVIVLQPQFWPDLRAIQARWQRSAEITNAWGNKVVEGNWLLLQFFIIPRLYARLHRYPGYRKHARA